MPKISVLIPAYNAEQYLEQCLVSVCQQTLSDLEIIVIDDGSTDKTGEIAERFAAKDSRVHVFHQENKGLYKARQCAFFHAKAEYIGWVDADDFIDSKMFEKLYEIVIEQSADLVYCDYDFYPDKIKTKEKWFRPYKGERDVTYIERNSQPWNKLVKRELLKKLHIMEMLDTCFDESYIKVLLEAQNVVSLNEPLYHYRIRPSSRSSSYENIGHYIRFIEASKALTKQMEYYWKENPYWKEYFEYREIYYTVISMLVAANIMKKTTWKVLKNQLIQQYPFYHKNRHFHSVLNRNFGFIKGNILEWIIPVNYNISHAICRFAFS